MEIEELRSCLVDIEQFFVSTSGVSEDEVNDKVNQIQKLSNYILSYKGEAKKIQGNVDENKMIDENEEEPQIPKSNPFQERINEIKRIGEKLWNVCVYFSQNTKAKKTLSKEQEDEDINFLNYTTILREISIDLIDFSWKENKELGLENYIRKRNEILRMLIRTGKEYFKNNHFSKSINIFNRGSVILKELIILQEELETKETNEKDLLDSSLKDVEPDEEQNLLTKKRMKNKITKNVFNFYCILADIFRIHKSYDKSYEVVDTVIKYINKKSNKNFQTPTGDVRERISMILYNGGVDLYNGGNIEEAIKWLQRSLQNFKKDLKLDKFKQSRTMRLLTIIFIKEKKYEEALTTIEEAQELFNHVDNIYLRSKIYLFLKQEDNAFNCFLGLFNFYETYITKRKEIETKFKSTGNANDSNQKNGKKIAIINSKLEEVYGKLLGVCHLSGELHLVKSCINCYGYLIKKFGSNKGEGENEFGNQRKEIDIIFKYIDTLVNFQELMKAKEIILQFINDFKESKKYAITKEELSKFNTIMWNKGVEKFDKKEHENAIDWFKYSLAFLNDSISDEEMEEEDKYLKAKAFRQISRCHIHLRDYNQALAYIQKSITLNNDSIYSYYLLFEIYCALDEPKKATSTIDKMKKLSGFNAEYLAVCAQHAYDKNHHQIAANAIEGILFTKNETTQKLDFSNLSTSKDKAKDDERTQFSILEKSVLVRSLTSIYVDSIQSYIESIEGIEEETKESKKDGMTQDFQKRQKKIEDVLQETTTKLANLMKNFLFVLQNKGTSEVFEKDYDKELNWFFRIVWNQGMSDLRKKNFFRCYEFLSFAGEFVELMKDFGEKLSTVSDLKQLYLMKIYCLLEVFEKERKKAYLNRSIKEIGILKKYCRKYYDLQLKKKNNKTSSNVKEDEDVEMEEKQNSGTEETKEDQDKEIANLMFPGESKEGKNGIDARKGKEKGKNKENMFGFLYVLEFKAKMFLNKDNKELISIINTALEDKNFNYFNLKMIVDLVLKYAPELEVCSRVISQCIQLVPRKLVYRERKIIKFYRYLMQFSPGGNAVAACVSAGTGSNLEQEKIVENCINFLKTSDPKKIEDQENYMNLNYILTKTWNTAVHFFQLSKFTNAERWGSLAVALCDFIKRFKHGNLIARTILTKYNRILESKTKNLEDDEYEDDEDEDEEMDD